MKQNITLTLRLSPELYREAKRVAQEKGVSFSAFLRRLLTDKLRTENEKRLFNSFSLVAEHTEEADVDYAFQAQREVILENE
ncbi:MAG: type II toxin-antitoxin system HicB family antitoxin [Deltaproteobacteria bacterium]|nr:type II toxin-antitoxin system HicB family antitoxin [Deltaproteobacteria bacterium]